MTGNPYTLLFGKEPEQEINRSAQMEEIYADYLSDSPSLQATMYCRNYSRVLRSISPSSFGFGSKEFVLDNYFED